MRIYKMNTYCFALIFYQILSTHSLRKYIKISLENLYVDIMGLKGLNTNSKVYFRKITGLLTAKNECPRKPVQLVCEVGCKT